MVSHAEKPTRVLDWFDRTWVNLFKNTATYVLLFQKLSPLDYQTSKLNLQSKLAEAFVWLVEQRYINGKKLIRHTGKYFLNGDDSKSLIGNFYQESATTYTWRNEAGRQFATHMKEH